MKLSYLIFILLFHNLSSSSNSQISVFINSNEYSKTISSYIKKSDFRTAVHNEFKKFKFSKINNKIGNEWYIFEYKYNSANDNLNDLKDKFDIYFSKKTTGEVSIVFKPSVDFISNNIDLSISNETTKNCKLSIEITFINLKYQRDYKAPNEKIDYIDNDLTNPEDLKLVVSKNQQCLDKGILEYLNFNKAENLANFKKTNIEFTRAIQNILKTNVFSLIENTIPFKNYIIKILSKQNSKEINFDNNLTTNPIFIQDDNDESINGVIFFYNGNPTDKNKKSLLTVDSNFVNFLKLGYSDFQVALSKNAVISLYDLTLYDQEISIDQYLLLEYSNKYKISELNKLDLNIDYFTYLFPDLVKRFDLLDKVNAKFKISKFYQNYNSDSLPAFDAILTLKLPNNFETNIEEEIKMEFIFEISSIKIGLNNTDKQKEYGIIFNPIYPKLISDIKIISKYNKIGLVYEFNLSIWLNKILKTIFLFSDLVNPLADNQKANIFLEERYPCLKINEMDDFFVFIPLNC